MTTAKANAMNYPTGNGRNHQDHLTRDPKICGGDPICKGMCIMLRTVLVSLAEGSAEEILADSPSLKAKDVRAAIAFAAASAEGDLPVFGSPHIGRRSSWTRILRFGFRLSSKNSATTLILCMTSNESATRTARFGSGSENVAISDTQDLDFPSRAASNWVPIVASCFFEFTPLAAET